MNKIPSIEDAEWLWKIYAPKAKPQGDCLLLGSPGEYYKIRRTLPSGKKVVIRAHQLALFLKLNTLELPNGTEADPIEASHLCHNKNCIQQEHLTAEPHSINMRRTWCNSERVVHGPKYCGGHGDGIPLCL